MVLGQTAGVGRLELSPELTSSITMEISIKRPIPWSNELRIKAIPTTKDSWQAFASPNQRTLLRLFMQVFCSIYFTDFSKRSISSATITKKKCQIFLTHHRALLLNTHIGFHRFENSWASVWVLCRAWNKANLTHPWHLTLNPPQTQTPVVNLLALPPH